jgi:UDP-2,4-diacetamido-2,4,6-trideoxy-beta-L-idose 2-epimerase
MTRRVAVFTGGRADYGLLRWLMADVRDSARLELQLIVSGSHLSPEFGDTVSRIEADGFVPDARVEMLLSSDSAVGVAKSMGLGTIGFADALERLRPDLLVVLGDRFEALSVVQAAVVMRIPVAHLHGGELTEGAYDDALRHAITKLSLLHFVAAEPYRRRVIQLGEAPERVFTVGALGLDHLVRGSRLDRQALWDSLGVDLGERYLVVTYHPATAGAEDPVAAFANLLAALDAHPDHAVLLTHPNADDGGRALVPMIHDYARTRPGRVAVAASLGTERYFAALRGAAAVVGNSSSGLIEAPSLGIPTVNVGIRQRGRLCAESVVHCGTDRSAIVAALATALDPAFAARCRDVVNPYGAGDAAARIVGVLESAELSRTKAFHDLEVAR